MIRNVSLILLFDKDKRILLQHRTKDAKRLPDFWGFFGGGIDGRETPEQALARESNEELGYKPQNPRLIMTQELKYKDAQGIKYIYMEEYDNSNKLSLYEGQAMGWFRLDDTKNLKMIYHDREVIEYIKNRY